MTCLRVIIDKIQRSDVDRFFEAVEKGDLEKVRLYHEKKRIPLIRYDIHGNNALHIAVAKQNMPIIEYIIQQSKLECFNINDQNFEGDTVFLKAVMTGNLQIVKLIMTSLSPDISLAENQGFTPLMAACAGGFVDVVSYFLTEKVFNEKQIRVRNELGQTAVHRAAFYGRLEVLEQLRKHTRLSFRTKDKKGNTPLHLAAQNLHMTCIRFILNKLKSITAATLLQQKNIYGESPLDILETIFNKLKDPNIPMISKLVIQIYIENVDRPPQLRAEDDGTWDEENGGNDDERKDNLSLNNLNKQPNRRFGLTQMNSPQLSHRSDGVGQSAFSKLKSFFSKKTNSVQNMSGEIAPQEVQSALIQGSSNKQKENKSSFSIFSRFKGGKQQNLIELQRTIDLENQKQENQSADIENDNANYDANNKQSDEQLMPESQFKKSLFSKNKGKLHIKQFNRLNSNDNDKDDN